MAVVTEATTISYSYFIYNRNVDRTVSFSLNPVAVRDYRAKKSIL